MRALSSLILGFTLFASPFLFADGRVVTLCYHTFLSKKEIPYDFSIRDLSNHMESIRALGYRFVSWDDIQNNRVEGVSNVLITVDDANASVAPADEAVFRPMGIKPVLFIYPAIISRVWWAMKWPQVSNFVNEGWAIGSHGYNHLFINQKLYETDLKSFNREIYFSKKDLERHMGANIDIIAYPFGSYSPVTLENAKKAGYRYAFTIDHGELLSPLGSNKNPYLLPRWMVTKGEWRGILGMLKDRLTPGWVAKKAKKVKKNA